MHQEHRKAANEVEQTHTSKNACSSFTVKITYYFFENILLFFETWASWLESLSYTSSPPSVAAPSPVKPSSWPPKVCKNVPTRPRQCRCTAAWSAASSARSAARSRGSSSEAWSNVDARARCCRPAAPGDGPELPGAKAARGPEAGLQRASAYGER
jgi:hypothetical protein